MLATPAKQAAALASTAPDKSSLLDLAEARVGVDPATGRRGR